MLGVNRSVVLSSLCAYVWRVQVPTVVCAYEPNGRSEHPLFLESAELLLDRAPPGDVLVLLGDFNAQGGNEDETWRGAVTPTLNPRGVLLFKTFATALDCNVSLSLPATQLPQVCLTEVRLLSRAIGL